MLCLEWGCRLVGVPAWLLLDLDVTGPAGYYYHYYYYYEVCAKLSVAMLCEWDGVVRGAAGGLEVAQTQSGTTHYCLTAVVSTDCQAGKIK